MELQPSYYAVIPANVRYDKTLPPLARLMYAEITALSNQYGYCFANNEYFMGLYDVTDRTVRNWIKALEDKGYITKSYIVIGKKKRRILSINPHSVVMPGNPLEVIAQMEKEEEEERLDEASGKNFPKKRKIISKNAENNFRHNNTSNINNNIYNARARAIPQKRAPDKSKKQKNNKFMNFEQRDDIDYQLLEERLLNKSSP